MIVVVVVVFAVPLTRVPILRAGGNALVVSDPLRAADVIVISVNAGGIGVLEAADLVQSGVAKRVAVFADPPAPEDLEFMRRGVPYEDWAVRSTMQLKLMGVATVDRIPRQQAGSLAEAEILPSWCDAHQFRDVILVTTSDHSRRLRRLIDRAMKGHRTRIFIRPSRYSRFHPDTWWQTRDGVRTAIIEFQKLALDIARHPFS
jgi:hypothetical protein